MITEENIRDWLEKVEKDERLQYKPADVFTNAPLALIQTQLETGSILLRSILELPIYGHDQETGKWVEIKDQEETDD